MKTQWQRWKKWRAKRLFLVIASSIFVSSLLFLTFSLLVSQNLHIASFPASEQGNNSPALTPENSRMFVPKLLGREIELDNPQRGPQYYGDEAPPPGWPLTDRYKRWCWRDIEPQQGQYNFSLIDKELETARRAGYTFGFRIMPSNPDRRPRALCLPGYLSSVSYNSPQYLQAARALFVALGQRYDHDPRLGWIDMSLYGCWGEWNESCGEEAMEPGLRQQLIDIQYQAFPDKRFLMLTDHEDSLEYALNIQRKYPTGIRADCLGQQNIGGADAHLEKYPQRWTTAPVYFEYCGEADFQQALSDIKTYHASIIGDGEGNINSFESYSAQEQSFMKQNYQLSGYRFIVNAISISKQIIPGNSFMVMTRWSNSNIAPVYRSWNVMIQLRDTNKRVVWQGKSALDLQTLLPEKPQRITDQFILPSTLHNGTYTLALQILDPQQYYQPLELAIVGKQGDRSYAFGSVTVGPI